MIDGRDIHRAAYYTLGCKLNFSETSTISKMLEERGFVRAQENETPDICIVNTCSVTEMADKKGRQLIRRIASCWPDAAIVVTGCYAQLKPDDVGRIEGVDIVVGSNEKLRMGEYIDRWIENKRKIVQTTPFKDISEFIPSCERGDRTRYFLKVQDGCDYFCSYCTIPLARGRSRSGRIPDLVEQAREVASQGGREIVITGVNIGDFGKDGSGSFFDLIRRLDEVEGIERYRISSIEPNLLTEEIIRWVALDSRAFMPHFHIPLQSGSDEVLKLMRRRYDTSLFAERIDTVRSLMPDAFIGVDVIAGARGESDAEWEKSYEFISGLDVCQLHVFPYSERPSTRALQLGGDVPMHIRRLRVKELTRLSEQKYSGFVSRQNGTVRKVLWEQPRPDMPMHGFTDNYLRVEAPYVPDVINTITQARLVMRPDRELAAEIV